jgi:hypothetical protein
MSEKCSPYKTKYLNGEYPECYVPCPPFYDICNRVNDSEKCMKCFRENDFVDYIE